MPDAEKVRLEEEARRSKNWKRWGPYLSERQWGTVREDYSEGGDSWAYFPHDHARSRAYRWGEDGLLGVTDRECRLCFALALWNGRDPILKERLFGLSGPEGNHGEDVKECYYYLDATPTYSYFKALYKYPQAEFPYARLRDENHKRTRQDPEFELRDTGLFDENRYFDVLAEYAKAGPDDLLIRITAANRGPEAATLHLVPTLWFRNTWSWGRTGEDYGPRPDLRRLDDSTVVARHETLGEYQLRAGPGPFARAPALIFTENETNAQRLFGVQNRTPFTKDAFHDYIASGRSGAVNPQRAGTKAGVYYRLEIPAGGEMTVRLRLAPGASAPAEAFGAGFDGTFTQRIREADEFYLGRLPSTASADERRVVRQAYAGLLWSRQFYYYVVKDWLEGDPAQPPPPVARWKGRNYDWPHLHNRDVISMPDKWEYPWYAAWDEAFHMIPFAQIDPEFAKQQLVLFLREWYMHPNGQLPAYEYNFGDVNPPVHAWAVWRVYKMTGPRGQRDRLFLERCFQKLTLNFTWWVNRKDMEGHHLFGGGFLGLDNIGVFDRSKPLPGGGTLEQADGTAWMAFFCATMLSIALELASEDQAYEDIASTFFEHFIAITDAMNTLGGTGLWDEEDGFYYDQLRMGDRRVPLRVRSMVGVVPLFAAGILEENVIRRLPGFAKRMRWFLENRGDLAQHIAYMEQHRHGDQAHRLLAIPSKERLQRVLRRLLDENEFLSPYGLRSLSKFHEQNPFMLTVDGEQYEVRYTPAEADTALFGGNSNWRGPVWLPSNYLLIESLERYHHFYGDEFQVECPTGSGRWMSLSEVARELGERLTRLFLRDDFGRRPAHGDEKRYQSDPAWRDLVLFYEYFHGDNGRGVGASHQTGWTALVAHLVEDRARARLGEQMLHSGVMPRESSGPAAGAAPPGR
ncbi:MAG TPA: hypothetical protein VMJ70_06740 [Candidatus Sulfotelmatobacter sp.]|nr:hypothetical protein [Candidatus Sulfotelmatobacter sp.]